MPFTEKKEQMLELNGSAKVVQDDDTFSAQAITFNMDTEEILMEGNVRGSVTDDGKKDSQEKNSDEKISNENPPPQENSLDENSGKENSSPKNSAADEQIDGAETESENSSGENDE